MVWRSEEYTGSRAVSPRNAATAVFLSGISGQRWTGAVPKSRLHNAPSAGLAHFTRYYWLLLAEGHLTRRWFGAMPGPDSAATYTDGIGGSWSSLQQNPSISWLGQGEVLQALATNGATLGCTGANGRPSEVLRQKNHFTMSRTGGTGVLWCCFRGQERKFVLK